MIIKYLCRPFHIPSFKISTNCHDFMESLKLMFGKYITETPSESEDFYEISVIKNAKNEYTLQYKDTSIDTNNPLLEIDIILFSNTIYDPCVLALHGAAVEWKGKAYLFLASTTTGKSTLASYLTNKGFNYITDDCILLNRENLCVHPYNRPINLREGGLEVLQKLKCLPQNVVFFDDAYKEKYIYTPDNCVVEPVPLEQIYFISRSETENSIKTMKPLSAIMELMKSPIIVYPISSEYLKFLSTLASKTCKQLIYHDMEYVAEIVRSEE